MLVISTESFDVVWRVHKIAKGDGWLRHGCPICPSARNSAPTGRIFMKFDMWGFKKKSIMKIQVSLTLRLLMSHIYIYIYIYMERLFLMFLDHTQRRSTVGRTPLDE